MYDEPLPNKTLRHLGELIVFIADFAWEGGKKAVRTIAAHVQPPEDMTIRTEDGGEYSGGLYIEGNDIKAGAVVRTGQGVPEYQPRERPWSSSTTKNNEPGTALKHWASDEPDEDEPPWRR